MTTATVAPAEHLLIGEEVDHVLRWPPGRAERLARKGSLPHVRLPNGDIRFRQSDLDRLIGSSIPTAPVAGANMTR